MRATSSATWCRRPIPDAGQTVSMTLLNEDTVQLRIGAAPSYRDGPTQVWHRCGPPTS